MADSTTKKLERLARGLAADGGRKCSFCLKHQREVRKLVVSATGAVICDECHSLCVPLFAAT